MMGFVNSESVSNFVNCSNASKSLNSCRLFPVKMILSRLGRYSCKFSAIRLQIRVFFQYFQDRMCVIFHLHNAVVVQQQAFHAWQEWESVQSSNIIIRKINRIELIQCGSHILDLWYFVSCKYRYGCEKRNEKQRIVSFNITSKASTEKFRRPNIYLANRALDPGTDLYTASMNLSILALT